MTFPSLLSRLEPAQLSFCCSTQWSIVPIIVHESSQPRDELPEEISLKEIYTYTSASSASPFLCLELLSSQVGSCPKQNKISNSETAGTNYANLEDQLQVAKQGVHLWYHGVAISLRTIVLLCFFAHLLIFKELSRTFYLCSHKTSVTGNLIGQRSSLWEWLREACENPGRQHLNLKSDIFFSINIGIWNYRKRKNRTRC